MSNMNYELIYRCQEIDILDLASRELREKNKAVRIAQKQDGEMRESLIYQLGNDDFVIDEMRACVARGISRHVWIENPKKRNTLGGRVSDLITGSGFRVCVFCGNDDFTE